MKGVGGFSKAGVEDLERVVEKSDTDSSIVSDEVVKPAQTIREHIGQVLHSKNFQIFIICLVVVDCLLVIAELLIDLKAFEQGSAEEQSADEDKDALEEAIRAAKEREEATLVAGEVLHYLSIAILSLFLIELCAKLFAMGKQFFHHKLEMLDAVVVVVSFALDIAFIDKEGLSSAFGLLVLLRLWRLARIANGIVLSVKARAEKRLAKEKGLRQAAEAELVKFREYCTAQEREIETLQLLLTQHDIEFTKMAKPNLPVSTIDVVAEVNQYIEANRMAGTGSPTP